MQLNQLTIEVNNIIVNIKDSGHFKKENDFIDYKKELNVNGITDAHEIFFKNFAKDILSFTNNKGGIILLGFEEDNLTGKILDIGLGDSDLALLSQIDLNRVSQKFDSITKCNIAIDLQQFQIGARKYYYIIIEKNNEVTIPIKDFADYSIKKGEIIHRIPGKNEIANENSQKLNRFLQIKANEKSKEFMEIWSKLLPEIFDINPKEILMINPKTNRIYGYNQKDKNLSGSEIEIDKSDKGGFNVILNAISAGEIGKISDIEGKPLYKIVGEIKTVSSREYINLTTLQSEIKSKTKYSISSEQLKSIYKYLKWTNEEKFEVENPSENLINEEFSNYLWIENFDKIKNRKKVVASEEAIEPILQIVNNSSLHREIFRRELSLQKPKNKTKK